MPALISDARLAPGQSGHQLESDVRRALMSEDGVHIASLVVRRLPNGVCLEGVIHVSGDDVDVCKSVRKLDGVGEVLNHLLVCWNCPEPSSMPKEDDVF